MMADRIPARYRITLLVSCALICSSCKQTTEVTSGSLPTRTYRMGFSGAPPTMNFDTAVAAILMWSQRADAAIISNEPPWDSLLAGEPPESLVQGELGLAQYYRQQHFALWVYRDPGNGLNRGGESDGLVRHGRSITEPAIQQMYRRYLVVSDSILRPDHLGVALETNLIRGASPPSLYGAIRQVANDAAADVRARDANVRLSVSVQVDYAWGRLGGGSYQGVNTDFTDFPFIQELGLSSYPYLAGFSEPDSIPLDYYARLVSGHPIPVMVTEGGWTSASVAGVVSSPGKQRRYIVRQAQLLDAAAATAVFQLTFTDIDLSANPPPSGSILPLFASLGLVDIHLVPKPALSAWDSTFARQRAG